MMTVDYITELEAFNEDGANLTWLPVIDLPSAQPAGTLLLVIPTPGPVVVPDQHVTLINSDGSLVGGGGGLSVASLFNGLLQG